MRPGDRRFWLFVAIILVSSALIAWSLVSLYTPLEYEDDYAEEDISPLDDENVDENSEEPEPQVR